MGVEQKADNNITGFPAPMLKQIANKRHSHHDKQKSQLNICDINFGACTCAYPLAPILVINRTTQHDKNAIISVAQMKSTILPKLNKLLLFELSAQ